jgi:replicative DNA helicase
MARRIAAQVGVTIDLSLYQHCRLLRLPNTINVKSGLYKAAMRLEELDDPMETILERAGPMPTRKLSYGKGLPNEALARLYQACVKDVSEGQQGRRELPMVHGAGHLAETPKHDKICVASLMLGVPNGRRNEACLRIGVHFRQKGMPLPMAVAALMEWNRHNQTPMDEMEVQSTARSAYEGGYEYGCHDEMLDQYCDRKCFLYPQKMKGGEDIAGDVLTTEELAERYMQTIKELRDSRVSLGIDWLNQKTRGLYPGQVCMCFARAGVGKTSYLINALADNSAAGVPALFCSLEQLGAEIFERMAQNATETTGRAIEEGFATGDLEYISSIRDYVGERFKNVLVCDKSALTITQLKAYVEAASQKAGTKIRLLCIDYFGLMRQEGRDAYQRASEVAKGLKEVAKDCGIAVLVLVQLSRAGGKGSVEVELDMARDSGQIEEAADIIVGMWRVNGDEEGSGHGVTVVGPNGNMVTVPDGPGYYPVYIKLLKNRKGQANEKIALIFRASVMRFEPVDWRPARATPEDAAFA